MSDADRNLNGKYVEAYENKHKNTRFMYRKEERGPHVMHVASVYVW